jgi:pantetheine-phosphate adenylyltransferase
MEVVEIIEKLKQLGVSANIENEIKRYDEPHRFYHNIEHIQKMLNSAKEQGILSDDLFLAIVFHDIIYNPKENNNEELSAELFYSYLKVDYIKQAILETKTHKPTSLLSMQLCDLDLSVLREDYETFMDFENKIFKEYQFVDCKTYKIKRLEILSNLGVKNEYLNYVKYRTPSIAVYAGSFNPFHKGHYDVLLKAEQIFDKVIIARGFNPEKNNKIVELPKQIQNRQIEVYSGLLTDFIDNLGYDVTLVRGLRNANDLQFELTQYRFLQDLNPKIKIVSLFCDKQYEHISSSAIRNLEKYNKQDKYLL